MTGWFQIISVGQARGAVNYPSGPSGPGAIGVNAPPNSVQFVTYVNVEVTSAYGTHVSGTATIITYSNSPNWFWGEIEVEFDNGEEAALQVDGSKTEWVKIEDGPYYQVIEGSWSSDQGGIPVAIELEPTHGGGGCAAPFVWEYTDWGAIRPPLYPIWY